MIFIITLLAKVLRTTQPLILLVKGDSSLGWYTRRGTMKYFLLRLNLLQACHFLLFDNKLYTYNTSSDWMAPFVHLLVSRLWTWFFTGQHCFGQEVPLAYILHGLTSVLLIYTWIMMCLICSMLHCSISH